MWNSKKKKKKRIRIYKFHHKTESSVSEFSAQKSQAYESASDDVSTAELTALLCFLLLLTIHPPALSSKQQVKTFFLKFIQKMLTIFSLVRRQAIHLYFMLVGVCWWFKHSLQRNKSCSIPKQEQGILWSSRAQPFPVQAGQGAPPFSCSSRAFPGLS